MAQKNEKKDTEKDILEAAKKIFHEKGYAGARMQAIADEANINKAMLHYYYRSKDILFIKILEGAVETISNYFIPALSSEGSVFEKIERLVYGYTEAISKNPHIPMFVVNELSRDGGNFHTRLREKLNTNSVFLKFIGQIQEEQKQGILKPIAPHHLVLTVISLIIFPFITKPAVVSMLNISDARYTEMMQERREIVLDIIRSSFVQ